MRANGVSQLPVCKNTPPFAAAEVSGAVDELELMEADRPRPVGDGHAGREGDGPEAADDRRRPDRSSWRSRCSTAAPALLVLSGGRPLARAHPHRRPVVLRGRRRRMADRWVSARTSRRAGASRPGPSTPASRPTPATGAVVTPISLSTTFAQDGVGEHKGFEYSRSRQPDPRRARGVRRLARRAPPTGWPSPAGWPPRTTCCACSRPGERVAARQRRLRRHVPADRQGVGAARLAVDGGRPHRRRRARRATGRPTPGWCGWRRRPTRC